LKTAHFDDAEAHRLAVASLREEINALSVRSDGAERLLTEARAELRERNAAIRSHEQNAREAALALQSHEQTADELEKSLAATHGKYSDADTARSALETRVADNVRELESRATALRRAQDQIAALEAHMAEEARHAMAELESRDAVIAKLRSDLETQTAARAFAEGALQSARHERAALRRADGNADAVVPEKLGRLSA
jgi:chromosome segregation ATPase